jgi:hypothetical protein
VLPIARDALEKTPSFAQREVIDSCANWIGSHALVALAGDFPDDFKQPQAWRCFVARLKPDSSLGLRLTIGLLITLAAMLGFSALADAVRGFLPISAKSPETFLQRFGLASLWELTAASLASNQPTTKPLI